MIKDVTCLLRHTSHAGHRRAASQPGAVRLGRCCPFLLLPPGGDIKYVIFLHLDQPYKWRSTHDDRYSTLVFFYLQIMSLSMTRRNHYWYKYVDALLCVSSVKGFTTQKWKGGTPKFKKEWKADLFFQWERWLFLNCPCRKTRRTRQTVPNYNPTLWWIMSVKNVLLKQRREVRSCCFPSGSRCVWWERRQGNQSGRSADKEDSYEQRFPLTPSKAADSKKVYFIVLFNNNTIIIPP